MGLALSLTLDIAVSAGTHKLYTLSLRIWEDILLKQTIYRLQMKNIHYFRFVRWIKSQGLPKNLEGYCKNVLRLVLMVYAQAFRLHLLIHWTILVHRLVDKGLKTNTIRNCNGKLDFVGCLLVKNGLWPADFSIMYTYYWYKMFKITVHCREVSGPESVFNQ